MDGGAAFYTRAAGDSALAALLATAADGGPAVEGGWPSDLSAEASFPRITFSTSRTPVRVGVINDFDVEVQIWTWPRGANGGSTRAEAIHERLLTLFDETGWVWAATWWNSVVGRSTDQNFGPNRASVRAIPIQMRGTAQ